VAPPGSAGEYPDWGWASIGGLVDEDLCWDIASRVTVVDPKVFCCSLVRMKANTRRGVKRRSNERRWFREVHQIRGLPFMMLRLRACGRTEW
jgi:hypothetical protein